MDQKTYRVADGVDRISAGPVPAGRRVRLTESEALYDLALGRIVPVGRRKEPATPADRDSDEG